MIHLLFALIFSEMAVILVMIFRNPLRKLVIMCLDRVKRGRGPIVIKTVSATILVMLTSSLYSIFEIRRRGVVEEGDAIPVSMNPTDQVLMARHLLEATLMGSSLFLALMIDRLHHYIRELRMRRKTMETAKKQSRVFEEKANENKSPETESAELLQKINTLEEQLQTKAKEIRSSEEDAAALRKQSEGLLMEYDRLQEENQKLRSQIQSHDCRIAASNDKKDT